MSEGFAYSVAGQFVVAEPSVYVHVVPSVTMKRLFLLGALKAVASLECDAAGRLVACRVQQGHPVKADVAKHPVRDCGLCLPSDAAAAGGRDDPVGRFAGALVKIQGAEADAPSQGPSLENGPARPTLRRPAFRPGLHPVAGLLVGH